jgi:hypothetical protein
MQRLSVGLLQKSREFDAMYSGAFRTSFTTVGSQAKNGRQSMRLCTAAESQGSGKIESSNVLPVLGDPPLP